MIKSFLKLELGELYGGLAISVALMVILAIWVVACGGGPPVAPTTGPAAQPTSTPAKAEIAITLFSFDPPNLTVKVGTTVEWTNQDSVPHTVTSDAGDWDSGRLSQGQSFSHTFAQARTVTYHCSIHPSMTGMITVTE
jgi:plastocyanin